MRGKVCNQQVTKFKLGITPACAGKRPRLPFFDIFGGDHPRVCGEKARCTAGIFPVSGSPSRVRGKENVDTYKRRHSRITPACAGKRQLALVTNVPNRDHPRVCGEKSTARGSVKYILGSPPRVRGKDRLVQPNQPLWRITPACAGKSCDSHFFSPLLWDHPRVCGEKQRCVLQIDLKEGSPPRVRGKVVLPVINTIIVGITPACAGKSIR